LLIHTSATCCLCHLLQGVGIALSVVGALVLVKADQLDIHQCAPR
jgi:hypothetical protein